MSHLDRECLDEGEILEFFAGRLCGPAREAIERHLDECPSCLDLVGCVAAGVVGSGSVQGASLSSADASSLTEVERQTTDRLRALDPDEQAILPLGRLVGGRYEVRRIIGIGGMGVVYSSLDRSLEREVALKVLRHRPSTQEEVARAEKRLLREARILAGLSHPNIVVAFDVGTDERLVFIAMELVHGRSVKAWLEASPPPPQKAILEVFVAAGRGLAAAHAAGVIHRDLKPANVLVGDDGRVRVIDFGLALDEGGSLAAVEELGYEQAARARANRPSSGLSTAQSDRQALAGTPRYMSPEQLAGAAVSAASDQFGFTLALAEALLGGDPFLASSVGGRRSAIAAGPVLTGSVRRPSRSLRRLLRRGLAASPSERYPSMEALCDELDRIRRGRPWRLWNALALLLVTVVSLVAFRVVRPATTCESGDLLVSEVWSPEVRKRITAAVKGTGNAEALETWVGLEPVLDSFAKRWVHTYGEVCTETSDKRSSQRQQALAQMACLERAFAYLSASASLAEKGDEDMLRALVAEGKMLPSLLDSCEAEEPGLSTPFPEHPAVQASVFALRFRLRGVWQLQLAGDTAGSEQLVELLTTEAEAIGYTPLLAEVLYRRGLVEHRRGDLEPASATLYRALDLAEQSAYDRLIPSLWLAIAHVDISRGYLGEAERALNHADASAQRGLLEVESRRSRLMLRAHLLRARGHHRAALAVDLELRKLAIDDLDMGRVLIAESNSRSALGQWDQALVLQRQVLSLREEGLPGGHTRIAGVQNRLGETLMALGEMQEAEVHLLRALELRERLGEDGDLDRSGVLLNVGRLAQAQEDPERALCVVLEALEIREARLGGEHPYVAEALMGVAEVHRAQGDDTAAVPLLSRAYGILDRLNGLDHPQTSLALIAYADARMSSDGEAAVLDLAALARALEVLESAEIRPDERAHARDVLERVRTASTAGP